MKETVSTLMDNELDRDEACQVIEAIYSEDSHMAAWNEYHLIGEALRSHTLSTNVALPDLASRSTSPRWFKSIRMRIRTIGVVAVAASVTFAAGVIWQRLLSSHDSSQSIAHDMLVLRAPGTVDDENPYFLAHRDMTVERDTVRVIYDDGAQR